MNASTIKAAVDALQASLDSTHLALQRAIDRNHELSTKLRHLEERHYSQMVTGLLRYTETNIDRYPI